MDNSYYIRNPNISFTYTRMKRDDGACLFIYDPAIADVYIFNKASAYVWEFFSEQKKYVEFVKMMLSDASCDITEAFLDTYKVLVEHNLIIRVEE